jgi:pimeloyl-[acyl-carrier protein] methyl ester esterase
MAYLEVEGPRRIYYERYDGSRRPVILVHGWGMSVRCWDLLLPALLDAGHTVVGFDHRGCGLSDKDFDDVSIDAIGSDVVRLVDHLGLDGVVVNGWSLGGAVAVDAAAKLGGRLGGLVLTGGATPRYLQGDGWPHGGTRDVFEQTLAALRDTRPVFLHALAGAVCHADVGAPTIEWMWQIFMQTSPRSDATLRELGDVDHRSVLPTLQAPALLLHGAHDQIVAFDTSVEAAKMLPDARLVEFDGSGHAPFLEESERYRREVLEFLDGLG